MTRIGRSMGIAAIAAMALAGCEAKPPAPPVDQKPKPPPSGAPGAPRFGVISAVCPALPAGLPVVKIQITDVSPKKLGHVTAQFEANQDGSASTDKKVKDIAEVVLKTENPTRLDFDASEFLKETGDVLLVEVELADAAAGFAPGPAAVTAGNDDAAATFCIRDAKSGINPRAGDRIVRFYMRYVPSKAPRFAKFNVFLLLQDGPYLTPVVLDPKIRDIG